MKACKLRDGIYWIGMHTLERGSEETNIKLHWRNHDQ